MSGIFKINLADVLRGLITAVLTAGLTCLQQFFSTTGTPTPINWKLVGGVSAAAAIGYLLKNLLTDSTGKVLGIQATVGPPAPHDDFAEIAAAQPTILKVESDPASPRLNPHPSSAAIQAELTQEELIGLMHARDRLLAPAPETPAPETPAPER